MTGSERREQILDLLKHTQEPISGTALAKKLGISRQVVVQDMALLRANGEPILSTARGYLFEQPNAKECVRVYKVIHSDEETADEMTTIIDCGGRMLDVFVYHKAYGVIRGDLVIKSRRDIAAYLELLKTGKSSLLKNVTGGYHYHTVIADSVEILDAIQQELDQKGYLAKLQDYEPVNFWESEETSIG